MRILFLTVPDKSHLYVAAPLASALRTAGHEVCVASQPGLADVITPSGLTGVAVGQPPDVRLTQQMNEAEPEPEPAATPDPASWRKPMQSEYVQDDPAAEFEALVTNLYPVMSPDPVFDDLVGFARCWQPDLLIWDMLTYAGPVAARACGAAHARLILATDGVGQLRGNFLRRRTDPDHDPMRDWLQPKLDRYGGGEFAEDVALGERSIDTMPPWTYHPDGVPYVPMRHLAFNGPAMAPSWLYEPPTRPRVCVTLGNSHRDAGRTEASADELLAAVADLDVEVVATFGAGQLESSSTLPDNIRTVDFVPLNVLLPTCSAIIHHGGAGTFAAAVEHGVPQLIVPSSWWSERWYGPVAMANGLEDRGAGRYVTDSDYLTAAGLRSELETVLSDPSFVVNAEQLRKETMEMPTPNDVVPELERLTAQHRAARP
jgi:glycosyltransferase (activator-dependent family)